MLEANRGYEQRLLEANKSFEQRLLAGEKTTELDNIPVRDISLRFARVNIL